MKRAALVALTVAGTTLAACDRIDLDDAGRPPEGTPGRSEATPPITDAPEVEVATQTLATGLRIPWGLAFLPDGTALVTERGNIDGVARIMSVTADGQVTEVQQLSEVDLRPGEGGLLGIAVSPDYETDNWVYVYYSTAEDNRIARLHLGEPPQPILTGLPVSDEESGRYHHGGRLAFGPDGMLYASVGEAYFDSEIAQDVGSLGGKILRLAPDGQPAPGNPFPDSPVWSYGHRNVQGLAWDADDRMYASELGADTYDELNLIEPGRNYGWPVVEGFGTDPDLTNPVATWNPTSECSPSGIAILGEQVYIACLGGQALYRLDLDGGNPARLLAGDYGRLRTVAAAPDGSLWVTTSNLDQVGEGDSAEGDRILRLVPSR